MLLLTSIISLLLPAPADSTALTPPTARRALYLGVHRAEYGGATHYPSLSYEWLLTDRWAMRVGIGGVHRDASTYTVLLNSFTGEYERVRLSRGLFNSALVSTQLRYFLWPQRKAAAGLFVGGGLQVVAEEFQQDSNSPGGYVSDIQVHAPVTARVGYQLRKGRWLLSGSSGYDFTARRESYVVPGRPRKGGMDVHVTTGADLQVGYAF
ncbi:hypothetical protein [Hymenobacter lapidiphilus]|uniref:Outer membrane protein beta-barrel domain-containing protein n=1 Tax=Hymenobacter lapidiphilus TaxID=2608003 RepID=A0A7Y7U3H1_9BACT|nr:hypothetical protein [Hymenobacter lapidiphilus]NVO29641.1 hypothetical protein [Hymenobacter lapidiphilus]